MALTCRTGSPAIAVDVIVHPWVLQRLPEHGTPASFRADLVELALHWVEAEHSLRVSRVRARAHACA